MKKTIKIEGMMCEHCVRAVKNGLEALPGVTAEVSLADGTAIVEEAELDNEKLRFVIEDEGYTVLEIL